MSQLAKYEADTFKIIKENIEVKDVLAENLGVGGASGVRVFDLDRVQMPSGGGIAWEVPSLSGPKPVQEIVGVVVFHSDRRVFWQESFGDTGGGTPPDCESLDGVTGVGMHAAACGGQCAQCPMSKFGTAMRDGEPAKGQACQQRKLLFIMRPEDVLPIVVNLSATSIGPWSKFALRLASAGIRLSGAVVALGLEQDKSEDGIKFSKVAPRLVQQLDAATANKLRAVGEGINAALSKVPTVVPSVSAPKK